MGLSSVGFKEVVGGMVTGFLKAHTLTAPWLVQFMCLLSEPQQFTQQTCLQTVTGRPLVPVAASAYPSWSCWDLCRWSGVGSICVLWFPLMRNY